jgi:hypothetical protein
MKPVTCASISNWSSTVVSASTTRSFAADRTLCGAPLARTSSEGSV